MTDTSNIQCDISKFLVEQAKYLLEQMKDKETFNESLLKQRIENGNLSFHKQIVKGDSNDKVEIKGSELSNELETVISETQPGQVEGEGETSFTEAHDKIDEALNYLKTVSEESEGLTGKEDTDVTINGLDTKIGNLTEAIEKLNANLKNIEAIEEEKIGKEKGINIKKIQLFPEIKSSNIELKNMRNEIKTKKEKAKSELERKKEELEIKKMGLEGEKEVIRAKNDNAIQALLINIRILIDEENKDKYSAIETQIDEEFQKVSNIEFNPNRRGTLTKELKLSDTFRRNLTEIPEGNVLEQYSASIKTIIEKKKENKKKEITNSLNKIMKDLKDDQKKIDCLRQSEFDDQEFNLLTSIIKGENLNEYSPKDLFDLNNKLKEKEVGIKENIRIYKEINTYFQDMDPEVKKAYEDFKNGTNPIDNALTKIFESFKTIQEKNLTFEATQKELEILPNSKNIEDMMIKWEDIIEKLKLLKIIVDQLEDKKKQVDAYLKEKVTLEETKTSECKPFSDLYKEINDYINSYNTNLYENLSHLSKDVTIDKKKSKELLTNNYKNIDIIEIDEIRLFEKNFSLRIKDFTQSNMEKACIDWTKEKIEDWYNQSIFKKASDTFREIFKDKETENDQDMVALQIEQFKDDISEITQKEIIKFVKIVEKLSVLEPGRSFNPEAEAKAEEDTDNELETLCINAIGKKYAPKLDDKNKDILEKLLNYENEPSIVANEDERTIQKKILSTSNFLESYTIYYWTQYYEEHPMILNIITELKLNMQGLGGAFTKIWDSLENGETIDNKKKFYLENKNKLSFFTDSDLNKIVKGEPSESSTCNIFTDKVSYGEFKGVFSPETDNSNNKDVYDFITNETGSKGYNLFREIGGLPTDKCLDKTKCTGGVTDIAYKDKDFKLFAYGFSGSGKTYTLIKGSDKDPSVMTNLIQDLILWEKRILLIVEKTEEGKIKEYRFTYKNQAELTNDKKDFIKKLNDIGIVIGEEEEPNINKIVTETKNQPFKINDNVNCTKKLLQEESKCKGFMGLDVKIYYPLIHNQDIYKNLNYNKLNSKLILEKYYKERQEINRIIKNYLSTDPDIKKIAFCGYYISSDLNKLKTYFSNNRQTASFYGYDKTKKQLKFLTFSSGTLTEKDKTIDEFKNKAFNTGGFMIKIEFSNKDSISTNPLKISINENINDEITELYTNDDLKDKIEKWKDPETDLGKEIQNFVDEVEDKMKNKGYIVPTSNNPNSSRAFTIYKIKTRDKAGNGNIIFTDMPGNEKTTLIKTDFLFDDDFITNHIIGNIPPEEEANVSSFENLQEIDSFWGRYEIDTYNTSAVRGFRGETKFPGDEFNEITHIKLSHDLTFDEKGVFHVRDTIGRLSKKQVNLFVNLIPNPFAEEVIGSNMHKVLKEHGGQKFYSKLFILSNYLDLIKLINHTDKIEKDKYYILPTKTLRGNMLDKFKEKIINMIWEYHKNEEYIKPKIYNATTNEKILNEIFDNVFNPYYYYDNNIPKISYTIPVNSNSERLQIFTHKDIIANIETINKGGGCFKLFPSEYLTKKTKHPTYNGIFDENALIKKIEEDQKKIKIEIENLNKSEENKIEKLNTKLEKLKKYITYTDTSTKSVDKKLYTNLLSPIIYVYFRLIQHHQRADEFFQLYFSLRFIEFICAQGDEINTALENHKFVFLKKSDFFKDGLKNYNVLHKENNTPFTKTNISCSNKFKIVRAKNSKDGDKKINNDIDVKDLPNLIGDTSVYKFEDDKYKITIPVEGGIPDTGAEAPTLEFTEAINRKYLKQMNACIYPDNTALGRLPDKLITLIAIRRGEGTVDNQILTNYKIEPKRCGFAKESLDFADQISGNSIVSSDTECPGVKSSLVGGYRKIKSSKRYPLRKINRKKSKKRVIHRF